jgi:tetratricopeptide (TPR) repeat protein
MKATPTIFLSYCWANANVADEIDNDFQITGITLRRDVRSVGYKGNIKEFMKTISQHDYVLVLVSNEFIRSANCMYEIMELLQSPAFKDKIMPVLVAGTKIFQPKDRIEILKYWEDKRNETLELLKSVNPTQVLSVQEDLKHYTNICGNIDVFLAYIKDTNCIRIDTLKSEGYKPMFDLMGIDIQTATKLEELIKIIEIEEEEEQEIAIDNYIEKHRNDYLGWFTKGIINKDPKRAKYKVSKNAYEKALEINPQDAKAHNNYANLLIGHFDNKEGAKEHYEKALEINPQYVNAHNNYASLLIDNFNDREGAKKHYQKALEINPKYDIAHNNYAILLIDHFDDKERAKEHYQKALEINPQNAEAHYNYANLLIDHFDDKEGAKEHYEKALEINPQDAGAHYNYANLLITHFDDKEAAKEHYQKALEINPQFTEAHHNYAYLLKYYFEDMATARQHYLTAIEINPSIKTPKRDADFGLIP